MFGCLLSFHVCKVLDYGINNQNIISVILRSGWSCIFLSVNPAVTAERVCLRDWKHDLQLMKGLVSISEIYEHTRMQANWGGGSLHHLNPSGSNTSI